MEHDYSKRDCLLPEGCKDLIDVLKLQVHQVASGPLKFKRLPGGDVPQILGELLIPAHGTVLELSGLLKKKPVQIILDLMEIDVFAHLTDTLDFETVARLVRRYGFLAKKAA
jgi:hypothetical protein